MANYIWVSIAVLLVAGRIFGAEPLAVVTFDGAARVSHGKMDVAPCGSAHRSKSARDT